MKFDQACLLGKELGRRGVTHVRSLLSLTLSIIHVPHSAAASTTDTEIFPFLSLSDDHHHHDSRCYDTASLSLSPVTANNSSDLVITRGGIPPRSPPRSLLPSPPLLSLLSPLGPPTRPTCFFTGTPLTDARALG